MNIYAVVAIGWIGKVGNTKMSLFSNSPPPHIVQARPSGQHTHSPVGQHRFDGRSSLEYLTPSVNYHRSTLASCCAIVSEFRRRWQRKWRWPEHSRSIVLGAVVGDHRLPAARQPAAAHQLCGHGDASREPAQSVRRSPVQATSQHNM